MTKTADQIKTEVESEIEAERGRLREAEQQMKLSQVRLAVLNDLHRPLNGGKRKYVRRNGNGKSG